MKATARRLPHRALAALFFAVSTAHAQPPTSMVDAVAFAPPPGAVLPLDARFVDDDGSTVRLGDFVTTTPAIVVPAYYGCSNLCGIVLHGLAASLRASTQAPRDVPVVAISIEPLDSPAVAAAKKRSTIGADATGWHFLTGNATSIARFANALGYRYTYDSSQGQYAHAAGIVVVAPGGRIARTLYGASFAPAELTAALRSARQADPDVRTAPASEVRTWLLCFHYDPQTGRYSFAAMNAVRAAALGALLWLAGYWVRARARHDPTRGSHSR